ncbi:MAG: preprotein translocase subunit YajC [Pseudomonadota bacterium]
MFVTEAYAQAAGAPASDPLTMLLPMVLIFGIFYFLVIRPQNKRMKDHKAKIASVKRGDDVATGGGIVGKVVHVREDKIEVEIAPNVRVKVLKGTLSDILTKPEAISATPKEAK